MTADAKIGLLLALVFIVAITFVINGLPEFLNKNKSSPDTPAYVKYYKDQTPALVSTSKEIAANLPPKPVIEVVPAAVIQQSQSGNSPEISYQTALPQAQEVVALAEQQPAEQQAAEEEKPAAHPVMAVYEVKSGDSLAAIAQKFYGKEQGNKLANIEKIFNANKENLTAIDAIQVGQKLNIPPLEKQVEELVKTGMFEKVSPTKETAAAAQVKPAEKPAAQKEQFRMYTIKESDNLWSIAQKQLGDGNRYREIMALNKEALKNSDKLTVGAKLKLPAK